MMASCKTVFRIRRRGAGYSASSTGFSYLFTDDFFIIAYGYGHLLTSLLLISADSKKILLNLTDGIDFVLNG